MVEGTGRRIGSVNTAFLGLGSNLGDRHVMLRAAVLTLGQHTDIRLNTTSDVASLYETSPVGCPNDQPAYLNSVVRVRTVLEPIELLDVILEIEASLGRVRTKRWASRPIDIDLLLFDSLVVRDSRLSIPHPRLTQRRFVLEPLRDLAPDIIPPGEDLTIRAFTRRLEVSRATDAVVRISDGNWIGAAPVSATSHDHLLQD